jgi:hypothetical protein
MNTTIIKTKPISLNRFWKTTPTSDRRFDPQLLNNLPTVTRRYLESAISQDIRNGNAPHPQLASAVRLSMNGQIKLGKKWYPFKGEEALCWNRGMIWRATTWMQGLPIWGADRLIDGMGNMQWKILGLFTAIAASGEDITRSAVGRVQGESVWLPSVLCDPEILWTELDNSNVRADFTTLGEPATLILTVNELGTLQKVKLTRWGNPEGGDYHYVDFGIIVDKNDTFEGYTIPTQIRAGWFFNSDRFESEGEFFRCAITKAIYR